MARRLFLKRGVLVMGVLVFFEFFLILRLVGGGLDTWGGKWGGRAG